MTANPINWFEIYVKDMPRAKSFYQGVFATKLEKLTDPGADISEMWRFPSGADGSGATGALVKMQDGPQGMGRVIISCEDCAVESARVPRHGGSVKKPKFSIGQYGFIAIVTDSEGNMIGLQSMK